METPDPDKVMSRRARSNQKAWAARNEWAKTQEWYVIENGVFVPIAWDNINKERDFQNSTSAIPRTQDGAAWGTRDRGVGPGWDATNHHWRHRRKHKSTIKPFGHEWVPVDHVDRDDDDESPSSATSAAASRSATPVTPTPSIMDTEMEDSLADDAHDIPSMSMSSQLGTMSQPNSSSRGSPAASGFGIPPPVASGFGTTHPANMGRRTSGPIQPNQSVSQPFVPQPVPGTWRPDSLGPENGRVALETINGLKNELAASNEEIQRQKAENSRLVNQNLIDKQHCHEEKNVLGRESEKERDLRKKAEEQARAAHEELRKRSGELIDARNHYAALNQQIVDANQQYQMQEKEKEELFTIKTKALEELGAARETIRGLEGHVENHKDAHRVTQLHLNEARDELTGSEQELGNVKQDNYTMSHEIDRLSLQIESQAQEIVKLIHANSANSSDGVMDLDDRLAEMTSKYEESQKNSDADRIKANDLEDKVRNLQGTVQFLQNRIGDGEIYVRDLDNHLAEKDREIERLKQRFTKTEESNKDAKEEITVLTDRIKQLTDSAEGRTKILAQNEKLEEASGHYEQLALQNQMLTGAYGEILNTYNKLHDEFDRQAARLKDIESENLGLQVTLVGQHPPSESPSPSLLEHGGTIAADDLEFALAGGEFEEDDGSGPCSHCGCPRGTTYHNTFDEVQYLSEEVTKVQGKLVTAEEEQKGAEMTARTAQYDLDRVEQNLAACELEVENLQDQLDAAAKDNSNVESLRAQRDAALSDLSNLKKSQDKLQKERNTAVAELKEAQELLKFKTEDHDDLEIDVSNLKEQLAKVERDRDALKAGSMASSSTFAGFNPFETGASETQAIIASLKQDRDHAVGTLETTKALNLAIREGLQDMTTQFEEAEEKIASLEEQLRSRPNVPDTNNEELEATRRALEDAHQEIARVKEKAQDRFDVYEKELQLATNRLGEALTQLGDMDEMIANRDDNNAFEELKVAQRILKEAQAEKASLEEQLRKRNQAHHEQYMYHNQLEDKSATVIAEQNAELEKLSRDRDHLKSYNEELLEAARQPLGDSSAQIAGLERKLAEQSQDRERLNALTEELQYTKGLLVGTYSQVGDMDDILGLERDNALHDELQATQRALEESQGKIASLEEQSLALDLESQAAIQGLKDASDKLAALEAVRLEEQSDWYRDREALQQALGNASDQIAALGERLGEQSSQNRDQEATRQALKDASDKIASLEGERLEEQSAWNRDQEVFRQALESVSDKLADLERERLEDQSQFRASLDAQNEELQGTRQALETALAKVASLEGGLHEQSHARDEERQTVAQTLESALPKTPDLEKRLAEEARDRDLLSAQNEEHQVAKQALETASAKIASLESERLVEQSQFQDSLNAKDRELQNVRTILTDATEKIVQLEKDLSVQQFQHRKGVGAQREELQGVLTKVVNLERGIEEQSRSRSEEKRTAERTLEDARAKISDLEQRLEQQSRDNSDDRVSELQLTQQALAETLTKMTDMEEKLAQSRAYSDDMAEELELTRQALTENLDKVDILEERLEKQFDAQTEEQHVARVALKEAKENITDLEERLEDAKTRLEDTETTASAHHDNLTKARQECDRLQDQVHTVEAEIRAENSTLLDKKTDELREARADRDVLQKVVDDLDGIEKNLNRVSFELAAACRDRDAFHAELAAPQCPHCRLRRHDVPGPDQVVVHIPTPHINPITCWLQLYVHLYLLFVSWLSHMGKTLVRIYRGIRNVPAPATPAPIPDYTRQKPPSVLSLVYFLIIHGLIYLFLFRALGVYTERKIWLDANADIARHRYINDWRRTQPSHSILAHLIPQSQLPEWARVPIAYALHTIEMAMGPVDRSLPG